MDIARRINRKAGMAAGLSLLLSASAGVYLLAAPCFVRGVSTTSSVKSGRDAVESRDSRPATREVDLLNQRGISRVFCSSLIEANGPAMLLVLLLPVALSAAGLVGYLIRFRILLWMMAALLLTFCLLTGFSVGLLYIPSAAALLAAALLARDRLRKEVEGSNSSWVSRGQSRPDRL